ncbi:P-loop containing nucleoside triphosphate hydrolase [Glarea lozoyensis ATCC 20868]|uniref:p-loop containing nucleoside triphosphate hydrolase n=1 Tax=Glarea lozoyensis (strain ATCC 20868 / MF5171) TaxID=1116229 RepID=S3DKP0_GLAL2|nr:P-loop containing nucleoside triphosphate hydrolase [Glarea lozoyensis ATCC 20868]EPE32621.1 P-loop containing nucleoside triphosphate hydrolase [Glarea lozoyensis ATCC 20868]
MATCAGRLGILRALPRNVIPTADLPVFLCPGLLKTAKLSQAPFRQPTRRFLTSHPVGASEVETPASIEAEARYKVIARSALPITCPGCGALAQTVVEDEPGYYDLRRRPVRKYINGRDHVIAAVAAESAIIRDALANAGEIAAGLDFGQTEKAKEYKDLGPPICDRCHNLKEHNTGVSIIHPSIQSIQDTIFESPYKYNHIYHVIDAADFPMSLIPGLHKLLHLTPQRSLNRRSKTGRFYHGQKTEISFIIQRSDLFCLGKEQLDRRMPWIREVLRDALGRTGKDVRLGNVRCVSSKMSWWTKELKKDIWERGGGGWLVGKVNVGKSQLLHEVFPKGKSGVSDIKKHVPEPRVDGASEEALATLGERSDMIPQADKASNDVVVKESGWEDTEEILDTSSMLPPFPFEVDYPAMPLVSPLPGTTASPIRLPFGNGKGELIDLPGLSRSDLENHVQPDRHTTLVMRTRVKIAQSSIKEGQSLLLAGFIRITPVTPDVVFLSYNFTSLFPHVTSTDKAIPTQLQTRESGIENISVPGTGEKIASAGTYYLKWDVTKERSGPLTSRSAAKLRPDVLPFRIFSTDILIEGVGWVELAAQVRKPRRDSVRVPVRDTRGFQNKNIQQFQRQDDGSVDAAGNENDPLWPAVEIFTPEGKYIGQRRPLNASLQIREKPSSAKGRPRRSMKGAKKNEKRAKMERS